MQFTDVKQKYDSLHDVHLAHHFRRPVVFRHLLCMGLVTPQGRIVSEREWDNVQRFTSENQRKSRISRLRSLASEGNLRKPTAKFPEDKQRNFSNEERSSPFPFFTKRKGIVGEPYLDSIKPRLQSRPFAIHSANGTRITKCSQVWERLFPPSSSCNILCWKQSTPSSAILRLKYLKKLQNIDIVVYQQPFGFNSRTVYSGSVSYKDEFEFSSCRKDNHAFSITIFENNICTSRVNTCCEYRYTPGKRIGGPSGHFQVVNIEGGRPCSKCYKSPMLKIGKAEISLNSSMDSKITIDIELDASETDITNNTVEEIKRKKLQKKKRSHQSSSDHLLSTSYINSFTEEDEDSNISKSPSSPSNDSSSKSIVDSGSEEEISDSDYKDYDASDNRDGVDTTNSKDDENSEEISDEGTTQASTNISGSTSEDVNTDCDDE